MGESGSSFPLFDLIGILACLLASAFFSGSETALTHIADTRARHLIESKPGRFGILKFWMDSKRRILADLLIGNNIVNILCSVLAYRLALHFLPSYAEAISVFGLALIILVFAEVTPKSLALHYSEHVAQPILYFIWVIDKLFFVLSAPLSMIPRLIVKRTGGELATPTVTEDEIEYQIRLGHEKEVFEEKEQGELLMSAVEFSDTDVKEVMIPRTDMFALDISEPLDVALEGVIDRGHSRVPVYRDNLDSIEGLLYAKDLLRYLKENGDSEHRDLSTLAREITLFVPETQKIAGLLRDMRRSGQHMAIVVDEYGGTSGIVTLEDIIEELVGEIRDEFDDEEALLKKMDEDTFVVDARLTIHDLKDATGIQLPDTGDYESVGGYVVAEHGTIPQKGAVVEAGSLHFTVLASDLTHVERIEIKRVPDEPEEQPD